MGLEVRKAQERTVEARALLLPLGAGQLSCLCVPPAPSLPGQPASPSGDSLPQRGCSEQAQSTAPSPHSPHPSKAGGCCPPAQHPWLLGARKW